MDSPPSRLSAWLLRPYLDLGPCAPGPLHALRVEECWRSFAESHRPLFTPQRALPPAFRTQLTDEAGRPQYAVRDPRELPEPLRTERWQFVCDALDHWSDLPIERRCRLVILLDSLCMYDCVLELVPEVDVRALPQDAPGRELAFWRALARYMRDFPNKASDDAGADMSVFEAIASARDTTVPAVFNGAIRVFVHAAKSRRQEDLETLARRAERALESTLPRVDGFMADLLSSRFYRALAFVPQSRGDRVEVVSLMDRAERHARSMKPATTAQEVLYLENLHALMESRTKEALWLGDRDLARVHARTVTEVDPYDSKAWVELGQVHMIRNEWADAARAYIVAGMLGPPASAVGRHMAGVCFRELGQDVLAAFFFTDALQIDPFGISPRDEVRALPDTAVFDALKEWIKSTVPL
ncbi:MAG TPA: hypothetical protein VGL09_20935 [Methylomirabilota bacterium]